MAKRSKTAKRKKAVAKATGSGYPVYYSFHGNDERLLKAAIHTASEEAHEYGNILHFGTYAGNPPPPPCPPGGCKG